MILRKANKGHKCTDCKGVIKKGESYYRKDRNINKGWGLKPNWVTVGRICMGCANKALEGMI